MRCESDTGGLDEAYVMKFALRRLISLWTVSSIRNVFLLQTPNRPPLKSKWKQFPGKKRSSNESKNERSSHRMRNTKKQYSVVLSILLTPLGKPLNFPQACFASKTIKIDHPNNFYYIFSPYRVLPTILAHISIEFFLFSQSSECRTCTKDFRLLRFCLLLWFFFLGVKQ